VAAPRFVGVRLDEEIVLFDRSRNSLIHLNATAVRVWEASASPAGENETKAPRQGERAADAAAVLAALEAAGVLERVDGRYVHAPIEWS
jgi:hypothetical protein